MCEDHFHPGGIIRKRTEFPKNDISVMEPCRPGLEEPEPENRLTGAFPTKFPGLPACVQGTHFSSRPCPQKKRKIRLKEALHCEDI